MAPVGHSGAWSLRVECCSGMQSPRCEATVGSRALSFYDCLGDFLSHQILKWGWKQTFPRHLLDLCLLLHLTITVPTLSRTLWFRGSCPELSNLTTLGVEPEAFPSGPKLCSFPLCLLFPFHQITACPSWWQDLGTKYTIFRKLLSYSGKSRLPSSVENNTIETNFNYRKWERRWTFLNIFTECFQNLQCDIPTWSHSFPLNESVRKAGEVWCGFVKIHKA